MDESGRPIPADPEVVNLLRPRDEGGAPLIQIRAPPIRTLWDGERRPPAPLDVEPPSPYLMFIAYLELNALNWVTCAGDEVRDEEFRRIYRQLRRRPDSTDRHPLVSHLRSTAQLYLALSTTSQAEYEAVVQRLVRSSRTFRTSPGSRNYLAQLRRQFQ